MDIYAMRQDPAAIRRTESVSKASGSAQYLDDMEMTGMTYGGILRCPYAHARVVSIDATEAAAMEGVLGMLTPADVPDTRFNCTGSLPSPILYEDERVLTDHPGHECDRVFALVADSRETLYAAMRSVKITYEQEPAFLTIREGRRDDRLINPDMFPSNTFFHKVGTRADVEEGFFKSDHLFEDTFATPTQHPIPMEPTGTIAWWNRDGHLQVWATTQVPYQDRRILAHIFGIPESDISCHRAMIGGGFGAREELYNQDVAAALSRLIYRPVKIIHDRYEEMVGTAVRHASESTVKMGLSRNGDMVSYHQTMHTNAGSYCTHTPLVTSAPDRKMPYHMPYFRYDGFGVLTNAACSGAFRGYGNPQASFAREAMINDACMQLGWDPVEFRYRNVCRAGERMHGNRELSTFPAEDVFEGGRRLVREIDDALGLRDDGFVKEAWGMALISHTSSISSLEGLTASSIICLPDGSVSLMTGTTDMGQGAETALTQVCAEKLGMDLKDVRHADLDTSTSPYNIGSYSSGQMYLTGNAVAQACEVVVEKAARALEKRYHLPDGSVSFGRDKRFTIPGHGTMTFKQAIVDIADTGHGHYIMGSAVAHLEDAPEPFSLVWARVAYYKKEEAIRLTHIVESVDIGRVMNPLIVKGQLEGAIQMGVGYALMEDLEADPVTKKYVTTDLLHYRNPLACDMPEIRLHVADNYEPNSANGTKSCGELGIIAVAPAIRNAVVNATGRKINALPLSRYFFIKNRRFDGMEEEED